MPHIFNNIAVVTWEELVPEFYPSYDALKKALHRTTIRGYGIRRVLHGGNGRRLLVDYKSLPNRIRERMRDPFARENPLELFYCIDDQAVRFYSDYTYNGLHIQDGIQDKYVVNASVLQAAIRLIPAREDTIRGMNGSLRGVMRSIWYDVEDFRGVLLRQHGYGHTLPSNERRFYQKFHEFKKTGYEALINKNLGNRNATMVNNETEALLNNIFADPGYKPSYSEVARRYADFLKGYIDVVNADTGELYDPLQYMPISKSTIYNYLSAWQNRIATHTLRSGDRQKNMGRYKPAFSFEQPKYAGSLLSIDDRQPPFKYGGDKRVWFYLGEDVASQAITCWVHGSTKEGMIMEFYRQLVRNYHEWGLPLPAELECESNLNASFRETFLKEGAMFRHVRIEPNNARGKSIESQVNRQLRYFYEKGEPGWQGRPRALAEANEPGPGKDAALSYNAIVEMALKKIEDFNNSPHPKEKGMSRWEYFVSCQNPDLQPVNYKGFMRHLGYKTETSCNVGSIRFNNSLFLLGIDGQVALGEDLINLMKQVEGREVDVYWLDGNDGAMITAQVYLRGDDRFICEAIAKPMPVKARIEQTEEDREKFLLFNKYKETVEGYNRARRQEISRVITLPTDKKPKFRASFRINGANIPLVPAGDQHDAGDTTGNYQVEVLPPIDEDEFLSSNDIPNQSSLLNRY